MGLNWSCLSISGCFLFNAINLPLKWISSTWMSLQMSLRTEQAFAICCSSRIISEIRSHVRALMISWPFWYKGLEVFGLSFSFNFCPYKKKNNLFFFFVVCTNNKKISRVETPFNFCEFNLIYRGDVFFSQKYTGNLPTNFLNPWKLLKLILVI